ncbi:MAG: hypothetical protein PHQ58_21950 [Rhodoferax sp.]|uniref:hypothetical protein n=1 Tax=Rhodoferax sp. TaxID=50421 RepID=UPI00261E2822|nr:hypothetical protein [Rhodoferax sp.]MDD2883085.1 hypothetical protein [Rhodoferax sp.]
MSTIELARAERMNAEAQAQLESARDLVQQNTERLNDTRRKMHFITERRVAGTCTSAEANEFAALGGDEILLQKMLVAAEQAKAAAIDQVHGAFAYFTDAKAAHDREMAEARFQALLEKTRQIEAVFCQALGALGRAGQAIGKSTLGSCFQKSDRLHRALDLNIIPSEES